MNETSPTPEAEVKAKSENVPNSGETIKTSQVMMNYIIIAVVFFVVGVVVGAISFQETSTVDKDLIQEAVSEILIDAGIMRPVAVMEKLADDDPYLGDENAPIVIVEFSAYACPFCGRHYQETLEPLLENYGQHIRYVYRDFPVINQNLSVAAALAANCANEQEMFWEYHDILFRQQTEMQAGTTFFMSTAETLGLNMETFTECYDTQRYIEEVTGDYTDGSEMQLSGTPAFFINGEYISGAQPYDVFEDVILDQLEELGIDV